MKKGDVIRQKCVNTTFYLTGILAHKVNNISIGGTWVLQRGCQAYKWGNTEA